MAGRTSGNSGCGSSLSEGVNHKTMWKGPENDLCGKLGIQKRNEIGMGYSRDGFHFYRPSYEP
jgi:hypothetical protein